MNRQWLFLMVAMFFVVGLALVLSVDTAMAQEICTDGIDNDDDKLIDCDDPDCETACKFEGICHNIGGPDPRGEGANLGANCDTAGPCSVTATNDSGTVWTLAPGQFFGIVVPFNTLSQGALDAHINHGDGPIVALVDPPLHLASTEGPHRASNVTCIGTRLHPQPPEPGN